MPNPSPTPEQINAVRDAAHLANRTDAEFYIARLNDAEWADTRQDITEWGLLKNKNTRIKADGVDIDKSRNRLEITNRLRRLFGLAELDENGRVLNFHDFEADEGTRSIEVVGGW